jgi:hypothetical protein
MVTARAYGAKQVTVLNLGVTNELNLSNMTQSTVALFLRFWPALRGLLRIETLDTNGLDPGGTSSRARPL